MLTEKEPRSTEARAVREGSELPRVTWLLPVKNGLPHLTVTLTSLLGQTYKNFEVLAWDNGSTDGTVEELQRWIPALIPGRVVTDKPLPLGQSLAKMVEECETELCARIDADDICMSTRLEHQVQFMLKHPDVAAYGSQYEEMEEDGFVLGIRTPLPTRHEDIVHTMTYMNPMCHPAIIFRRSMVLAVGNYSSIKFVEDYDLWMRLAARYKLANSNFALIQYRLHPKSITRIAQQANVLAESVNSVFYDNAPTLYGISAVEAKQLREHTHSDPVGALLRMARYLAKTQPGPTNRLRSGSFLAAARTFLPPDDRRQWERFMFAGGRYDRYVFWIPKVAFRILRAGGRRLKGLLKRSTSVCATPLTALERWLIKERESKLVNLHLPIEILGREHDFHLIELGRKCWLEHNLTIWLSKDEGADPRLCIGDEAYIGRNSFLGVYQPITIGKYAQLGAYCYIVSANHRFERRDIPIMKQGFVGASVTIGEDAWLGTHVVVLPGVTIGKGAIVAAGSLVNKDIPEYEIWGGVPAKYIRTRPE